MLQSDVVGKLAVYHTGIRMRTPSLKTRVGIFGLRPSGRTRRCRRPGSTTAPGCRASSYETVSGPPIWPSRDPIGERGGINLYGYVNGNPLNSLDPLGLCPCENGKVADDAGECCKESEMQTVTLFNWTHAIIPHTFIQTPTRTVGFYPKWRDFPSAPGQVNDDSNHQRDLPGKTYRACPQSLAKLQSSIDSHQGGLYDVLSGVGAYNCTSWACARLKDAGFTPPASYKQPGISLWQIQGN